MATETKQRQSANGSGRKSWAPVVFGDVVVDINVAERNPRAVGLIRYVGLEHLEPECLTVNEWGDLTVGEVSFTKRFSCGQVLFGKRRAYQRKVAVAQFDGICSSDILTFAPKNDELSAELLPFIVQSDAFFDHALDTSSGSLSPRTRWSQLKNFEFRLPPRTEQDAIAKLLKAAYEQVENWRKVQIELRAMLRSIREFEFERAEFPRIKLGELLDDIVPGRSVVGRNEPAKDGEYGVIKVSAVGGGGFEPTENKVILNQSHFMDQFVVVDGDLLITRSNTPELVGRVCLVNGDYPHLMLCDKTIRLVPNEKVVSKLFLLEALRTDRVRKKIMGFASGTGGAMKNISQDDIRELPVSCPSRNEQLRLHAMIESLHSLRSSAAKHVDLS